MDFRPLFPFESQRSEPFGRGGQAGGGAGAHRLKTACGFACLVTSDPIGNEPFPARNRSPAKAGVHAEQRYAIWAAAFAGEQLLPCLKDIMPTRSGVPIGSPDKRDPGSSPG